MKAGFLHAKAHFRWYLLLFLMICSLILWSVILHENRNGILTFAVLNIGQGDALFIESPTGVQVIVDGGPGATLLREVRAMMPWYDRSVDMIVVTNPDKDHYEGFISFLRQYRVSAVLEPGTTNPNSEYEFLEDEIKNKNIPKIIARKGQVVDLGGGAYLQILFPDRDVSGLSSNDGSLVMKLVYGDTSVMLQGDSTARIEQYLVQTESNSLYSTILKAGHHGSRTSTTEEYVVAVSPQWTVISSGKDNSYGHPHKETLDTLEKLKIPALDICNNGRIIFKSDGKEFTLKNKNPKPAGVGCKSE